MATSKVLNIVFFVLLGLGVCSAARTLLTLEGGVSFGLDHGIGGVIHGDTTVAAGGYGGGGGGGAGYGGAGEHGVGGYGGGAGGGEGAGAGYGGAGDGHGGGGGSGGGGGGGAAEGGGYGGGAGKGGGEGGANGGGYAGGGGGGSGGGPVLIKKLNEEIELGGLKDQISVTACSHVGGHKYAGNLIIYRPGPDGKIMGHWYGYVTPNDVPELLDQHIVKGEVIQRLWRGQMGPSVAEVKGADDQKVANGEDTGKGKENHAESDNLSNNENVAGCCQGVNGVSCCRNASFEKNKGIEETTEAHKKQGSKISWNWPVLQERDILAAVSVLGAVAVVAVAYKLYKRSG